MSAKDQIKQIVDYFKREPQLKDKTDGMAEGLLLGANLADDANELSKETDASFKALQREYTENGNGSQTTAEITVARDGELVLDDRLNRDFGNVNAQLALTTQYPILDYEYIDGESVVVNPDYPYNNVKRYGLVADYFLSTMPHTNNYPFFLNLMAIASDGQEFEWHSKDVYYFEGEVGLLVAKQLSMIGKGRPNLLIKSGDGNGITFLNRNSKCDNFRVRGYDRTKGVAVRGLATDPDYNAYCEFKNIEAVSFGTGFFFGNHFSLSTEDLIAHNCSVGFSYKDVATMLFSKNCYARSCDTGHMYENINYSKIINSAVDHSTLYAYRITNVKGTTFDGMGLENGSGHSIEIKASVIGINGLTADRTSSPFGSGTVMSLREGSEVLLADAYETVVKETSESQRSIVVDGTSVLNILNSRLVGDIFLGSGGQINGTARTNGVRQEFKRANKIFYASAPPTQGTHKAGDVVENTDINVTNNPVNSWVCIVGGTPGTWRPSSTILTRGRLSARPSLSGFNHIGVQFMPTGEDDSVGILTWDSLKWVDASGNTVP